MSWRRRPAASERRGPGTGAGAFASVASAALLAVLLSLAWNFPAAAFARPAGQAAPPAPPEAPRVGAAAGRDSLVGEIRRYRQLIRVLSDSLQHDRNAGLSPEHRIVIERNIGDITRAIEGIGSELRQLEFKVKDNRISLVDGAGDGIVISVPENLDEQVSRGLEALTAAILKELPDTARTNGGRLSWTSFLSVPEPPAPPRRVIDGNLVRVGQSLVVAADEEVHGNVVVVLGDCDVAGRIKGNVVVVGGHLAVRKQAEVSGSVVSVGGRLDADPGAKTGDTVALGAPGGGAGTGIGRLFSQRTLTFAIAQGLFLLTLLAGLLAAAASPDGRIGSVLARLSTEPWRAFGLGALLVLCGPFLVAALTGLLVITVIGVPVALLLVLGVALVVVLGLTAAGAVVGRRLGVDDRRRPLAVLVGLCVLHVPSFTGSLLHLVGAPWAAAAGVMVLGLVIKGAALAFGLGALALSRLGTRTRAS
jgi:hypothetical protein